MKMILRWLACLTVAGMLFVSLPGVTHAQPKLPHFFYGTLTINGSSAPVGTVVTAKVGGVERGSYTTTQVGKYGNRATSDYLLVQGDIVEGATINFYVNGVDSTQTAAFIPGGGPTELNLTATIPPTIAYSPSSFSFSATQGEANPASQTLSISNSGVNPLAMAWSVTDDATWLSLSPASGSSNGEVDSVAVSVSISGMGAGSYSATITISAPGATNTPRAVPVTLVLASPPAPGPPPAITTPSLTGLAATVPLRVDAQGIVQASTTLTTADGKLTLDIAKGTKLLDSRGNPLASLSAAPQPSPPAPPPGAAVILAYNLGPDGATFSPEITLTIEYDPKSLPKGVAEENLYIAYWDGSKWVVVKTTVNAEANTASCKLSHFTTFAVIAPPAPPAPAAFSLSNLTVQPTQVQPKQAVTITVSVANTGGVEGSYTVILKINGVKEAEKSVTIAAGSSQTVSFSVAKAEAGSYSVAVDGLSGSFTVVAPPVVPPSPAPAAFSVSNLSIQPTQVQPKELVTITMLVANTGGTEGSYTVVLKINNVKETEKIATLGAGKSQEVSFSVSREEAGSYTVTADGLSGSFTVVAPPVVLPPPLPVKPSINWPLIGGIIAAVVVVGLVIFYFARRRAD